MLRTSGTGSFNFWPYAAERRASTSRMSASREPSAGAGGGTGTAGATTCRFARAAADTTTGPVGMEDESALGSATCARTRRAAGKRFLLPLGRPRRFGSCGAAGSAITSAEVLGVSSSSSSAWSRSAAGVASSANILRTPCRCASFASRSARALLRISVLGARITGVSFNDYSSRRAALTRLLRCYNLRSSG